ncbi:hypothetical protein [Deinococcus navajonensis]|uniref:Uncharacterized protein n=1 Tax=Deinococcus navajonensis TaxID=309884 RepID=A0ABV8XRN8_9DEIO
MDLPRPSLLVVVPPDWEAITEGVAELRRYLSEEFGAALVVRGSKAPMRSPLALYLGVWDDRDQRVARRDVDALLPAAFYTLNWLEEVS